MTAFHDRYQPRYGQWGGNPKGNLPDHSRCAAETWSNTTMALPKQCDRKNGHGPEGAYCKQHAKRFETTV